MTDYVEMRPVTSPPRATVRPPGSKSITNRALICAALAEGRSTLIGALDSEDTQVMIAALGKLGIEVRADVSARTIDLAGCGGTIPAAQADLFVANSGTSMRFLAALASLGNGSYRLDGTSRMRERPIADLVAALGQLGADVSTESPGGCPPIVVRSAGLPGGRAAIAGDVSSQFLSGLLMAAPYARRPVEIEVTGALVSVPYVRMTLAVMSAFGIDIAEGDLKQFNFARGGRYRGRRYEIEPDASAASYFFGAAAVTQGEVTVEGLSRESLQGDVAFADVLSQMGCDVRYGEGRITLVGRPLAGIDVDMNAISDTVQTLAAVALSAQGPTTIRGVAHIRHKETDRLTALATELRKLGAKVDQRDDGLKITPGTPRGADIDTYDDHRMAMSLALVGLTVPGVRIHDPGCTAKTYPRFFEDLAAATGPGRD